MFFKTQSRTQVIVAVICACLLIQLVISHKLWLPIGREFPMISAFEFLNIHYGIILDGILYSLAVVSLIAIFFLPFNKLLVYTLVFVFFLFILEDIMKLQPWLYLFCIMLLTVAVYGKDKQEQILFVLRVILAATYFWSGLQKFNHAFTTEIFPWLMKPLGLETFFEQHHRLGYIVPIVELSAGLALLYKKLQKPAGIVLILIHLVLLYSLGPWASNWNILIWPWNLAMIIIIWVVIRQDNYEGIMQAIKPLKKSIWLDIVCILLFIMPAFNFVGCWDHYLSGSLYSGHIPEAIFYCDRNNTDIHLTSVQYSQVYYPEKSGEYLVIDAWALAELKTPVYPENRYFRRIGNLLCNKTKGKSGTGYLIIEKKRFTSELQQENCKCDSITNSAVGN